MQNHLRHRILLQFFRYIHIDIKAIPVHESLHFQISLGILYFILQRNGMQTSSKHITDVL